VFRRTRINERSERSQLMEKLCFRKSWSKGRRSESVGVALGRRLPTQGPRKGTLPLRVVMIGCRNFGYVWMLVLDL
jgi:hypothetical protein